MDAARSAPGRSPARSVAVSSGARFGLASHQGRARRSAVRQQAAPRPDVSVQEAATLLGVHACTIYRYIKAGLLAHKRLGSDPPQEGGTGRRGGGIRIPVWSIDEMRKVRQQQADGLEHSSS
ncbi:helix-turn-helix domain-containing protein [Kitasatospora sp. NPDC002227]|uniref:helix-turn-helix domain-containing protein n=1 Tax=Kitasatospora sp. NPDC002227 TaxID=3154773 RepID=UPI00332956DF